MDSSSSKSCKNDLKKANFYRFSAQRSVICVYVGGMSNDDMNHIKIGARLAMAIKKKSPYGDFDQQSWVNDQL